MDFRKKLVCDEFMRIVREHLKTCEECSRNLSHITKELPALRFIISQEEINSFIHGKEES